MSKTCKIDHCGKPPSGRGWCGMHYQRWRKHGTPMADVPSQAPRQVGQCLADECERDKVSRGFCGLHYKRLQVHGDVDKVIEYKSLVEVVDGLHICPYCGKGLSSRSKASQHAETFHYDKLPSSCTVDGCERRFLDDRGCQTHIGYAHPEQIVNRRTSAKIRRSTNLRNNYGITVDDYDRMLEQQDHGCAGCGADESSQHRNRLYVDHCHESGEVRGLLCMPCNMALGQINDDPEVLRRLAAYLEEAAIS